MAIKLLNEDVWKAFTNWFRYEAGHPEYTDDEIELSRNDDDVERFIEYLVNKNKEEVMKGNN